MKVELLENKSTLCINARIGNPPGGTWSIWAGCIVGQDYLFVLFLYTMLERILHTSANTETIRAIRYVLKTVLNKELDNKNIWILTKKNIAPFCSEQR
jgi:hypothetical protein